MLTPQSGKEWGGVKSLSVAVVDWDERVSAMNVLKHGTLSAPPKIAIRSTPPSKNSPGAKVFPPPVFPLSVKGHGEGLFTPLTIAKPEPAGSTPLSTRCPRSYAHH